MQLGLICVGRMKAGPGRGLLERYPSRIKNTAPQLGMSWHGIIEVPEGRAPDVRTRKAQEAASLAAHAIQDRPAVIVLDERGKDLTSDEWAKTINQLREDGYTNCHVLIGGPDGHDPSTHASAYKAVSLGKQTMPHQLVRIIVAEQLYRVLTILSGHPYHRQSNACSHYCHSSVYSIWRR